MNATKSISFKIIENLAEVNEVVNLQTEIWGRDTASPLPQLVASIHHGGIIIGAFHEKQLIGFCYGFAGFKDGETYLISHMAAVIPDYQNFGVGYQLKLKQREWAMAYGYQKIVWTFDPLEIRNGYFNLCKLGAYTREYIPSYYGEMNDKLNNGLTADRFLIEWDICTKRVENAILGKYPEETETDYQVLLTLDHGRDNPYPVEQRTIPKQKGYLVPVPTNIQVLKQTDPEVAKAWRYTLRSVFTEYLSKGYVVTGVRKIQDGNVHYYILENLEAVHDWSN